MTAWRAAQAKAQFSEMLDRAEAEGPQLVQRRKQRFVVMTEEAAGRTALQSSGLKHGKRSAWELLRPPDYLLVDDVDFPRTPGEARAAKFEVPAGYKRPLANQQSAAQSRGVPMAGNHE